MSRPMQSAASLKNIGGASSNFGPGDPPNGCIYSCEDTEIYLEGSIEMVAVITAKQVFADATRTSESTPWFALALGQMVKNGLGEDRGESKIKGIMNAFNPAVAGYVAVTGNSFFPENGEHRSVSGWERFGAAMSLIPGEGAISKSLGFAKVGKSASALSEIELVTKAAQKAENAIGGVGAIAGTAKHKYATALIDRYQSIYGSVGLETNVYFNHAGKGYLDALSTTTSTIYDFKFGVAKMSNQQFIKYSTAFPGFLIEIIKP
jgi:hypothetical protein